MGRYPSVDAKLRNPTTGIAGCCARAASGQAAAALPSATSNSRRPMVTVIRALPCEVRKWNDTTPRACCPNSAAPGAGQAAGARLLRDLSSAAPLHFLLGLQDDVDARGFL